MADEELEVRARLIADAGDFITPMDAAQASLKSFQKALQPTSKSLVALGAAAGAAGYAILRYGKEAFGVAAKVSELRVAIDAVGKSTGIGAKRINDAAKAIRSNGIEMDAAQNIALKFAQNNLDLSKAAGVARVAQDLAVISQKNSTDTAELLTRAIQTGSSILLKSAGISRYASEGYAMYAKTLGKNATQLTATERQQATINLIMDEGTRVAGLYEAAMTEPGKVLRSFARLQNDMKLEMGNALLQGFGPMIKAAYDLTKSFSESLREGGAFSNILKGLGIALKDLLQPMSDLLSRGHRFFKDLEFGSQSVDQIAAQFKKFLPIVTAVGAGLAAFAGRKLLGGIPIIGTLAKSFNPLLTAVFLLSALSPKLRESLVKVGASLKPLIPAVLALGASFAEMIALLADFATGLLDAFGPVLSTVLGGLAEGFKMVAGAVAMLKPVLMIVGLLLVKNFVVGAIMANQRVMQLIAGMKQMGIAFKMAIVEQKRYSATTAQGGKAITTFQASLYALKASLSAVKAAVVSLMASLLPLLAIYAGIEIFMAWRKEQKATEERTKELTQSVKDQLYAMKGDVAVINEFVQSQRDLSGVLTSGSDAANELGEALNVIGADAETALKAFSGGKESIRNFNIQMVKMSGLKFDSNQLDAFLTIVENQGGWANIDSIMKKTGGLSDSQIVLADSLKKANDLLKSTDPGAYVMENMQYLAGIDKLGKKAYDYTVAEIEKNEALADGIDTLEEAQQVQEIFASKYAKLSAAARASKVANDDVKKSVDKQNQSTLLLIANLNKLKDASDDAKVSAQAFGKEMYGDQFDKNQTLASFTKMREQATELAEGLKNTKGNTDLFAKSGMELFNVLTENSAAILELGGNSADVAKFQKSAVEQFYAGADAAGWEKEQVDALLSSLGILAGLEKITVQIDVDIARFKEKIVAASKALALFMQQGDSESARMARVFITNMEGIVKQLEAGKQGAITGANSFDKFNSSTDAASKAASKLEKEKEKLRKKIMEVAEKALLKARERMEEYKQAMDDMRSATTSAIYGAYSFGDAMTRAEEAVREHNDGITKAKEELKSYTESVGDALTKAVSFSEALSGYDSVAQDIAKANESVAEAQSKVNEEQTLYSELLRKAEATQGRKARREAYEEAAKQLEKVTQAQTQLGEATSAATQAQESQKSVLDRLREQYQKAVKFSGLLNNLVAKGLSREGYDQVLAMGAETGIRFAEELLGGSGEKITEVNKMFTDLSDLSKKSAEVAGKAFFKIGDNLGADFIAALASKAHEASKFTDTIKRLVALGLSPNNIRMVLEAGVEAGSKIALAIEKGGADTVRQMNEWESSLRGQAENLATLLNNTFYKTGFDLATQIVQGIEDKIEDLNEKLANMTVGELKAYLNKVQGEFDAILKGLPSKPADQTASGGAGAGGATDGGTAGAGTTGGGTSGRRSDADLVTYAKANFSSFKEAVKAMHPEAVAKYMSDGTGLNASEMLALRAQFPRLAAVPFAAGGIVSRPTLGLVGEAGPEAVIPLNRMGAMGGQTVINLTVNAGMGTDGKSVGDAIVNELKRWSRKNGKIPVETT